MNIEWFTKQVSAYLITFLIDYQGLKTRTEKQELIFEFLKELEDLYLDNSQTNEMVADLVGGDLHEEVLKNLND